MNLAPHPFTLRQLQYFVAVAEALSFRKAAERCHVSQPSLSAQIAQLEGALGVQLFERDRRRVLLTPVGLELVERARRLLVEVDALTEAAKRAGDPLSGTLRLGVIPTVSPYLLPAVAPTLRKRFPRLTVRWLEDKTEVLVRDLDRGALDAALVALEAEVGDVESAVLAEDPFFLVTPRDHPLGQKKGEATPAELRGQDVLLLDEGHCFRTQALALCSRARAHELEFRATSLPTLTQMIASGAGISLLPALAVATEVKRSDLKVRPFAEPVPKRTLALVWRKRSPFTGALKEVAGAMREAWPRK
ncbi:LysR family transcriptional regulator [Pyxidicoccus fallax]|uniref:LysR family transcriptional regulator n=1 Tax=Pyxidicoccus fallax TaxID=394095 RepID=A0A848LQ98_9BACT|nr:LysR substrate-binding domain-containing protein [Pyxidicoccus fallax]NMO19654.1 LysR family transcriptional regulator [Pyxidicoccus fallax]NPC80450.1 LysR family transcriptional regulator [Pyxidicoccus fallax]